MTFRIASADQSWLQETVVSERRRLASLHRAALINANAENTETAINDHKAEGDVPNGYEGALADHVDAPKPAAMPKTSSSKKALFSPENPDVSQPDLEMMNMAQEQLEDEYPQRQPQEIADILGSAWTPGMNYMNLMVAVQPMLSGRVASKVKKASELKAEESGTPPNTETATKDHDFELKALAKQIQGLTSKPDWDPNDPMLD